MSDQEAVSETEVVLPEVSAPTPQMLELRARKDGSDSMKATIIKALQNEANRLAQSGAKRNARIIRNALVEIHGLA
jgi:hypothetical protein